MSAVPTGRGRRIAGRTLLHVVVVLLMVVWFVPVVALVVSSFRTQQDMGTSGWWDAFLHPLFTTFNFVQAADLADLGGGGFTSLLIAVPATIGATLLSAIGAFVLARMRFRGRTAVSLLMVALIVVPPQVTIVPLLRLFVLTGFNGSVAAVWLYQVGVTVPFGVFLIRGFIAGIPDELFEAAAMDGASMLRVFRSIALPLCGPILASLAILQFLWSWNDLLIPLVFLGGSQLPSPITVEAATLATAQGQGITVLMAATLLSVLPPLIVLVSLQRYFVRGILGGAGR